MQTPSIPTFRTPQELFWFVVAAIFVSVLGGGGLIGILSLIINRKKPNAEIHESEARTAESFAKVRSLDLQTNISAGDAVLRLVQQLTFAQATIERLHDDVERLTNENDAYERQFRSAKAMFKLKGLTWPDRL